MKSHSAVAAGRRRRGCWRWRPASTSRARRSTALAAPARRERARGAGAARPRRQGAASRSMARQGPRREFLGDVVRACREEMPEFIKAQAEFGAKGLQFVGIAVDQADKVAAIRQRNRPQLPDAGRRLRRHGALEDAGQRRSWRCRSPSSWTATERSCTPSSGVLKPRQTQTHRQAAALTCSSAARNLRDRWTTRGNLAANSASSNYKLGVPSRRDGMRDRATVAERRRAACGPGQWIRRRRRVVTGRSFGDDDDGSAQAQDAD